MGFYVNTTSDGVPLPANNKGEVLVNVGDAVEVRCPASYSDIKDDQALLVEMFNRTFSGLGYAFNEREFEDFVRSDGRIKRYFIMDKNLAKELTHF